MCMHVCVLHGMCMWYRHLSLQINKHMCTHKDKWFHSGGGKDPQLPIREGLHWTTFSVGRQCFALTGVDTHSGYGLASPARSASAKTTCGLSERLIRWHGILHGIASHQGRTSQGEKCDRGPTIVESTGFTRPPTILKQLAW